MHVGRGGGDGGGVGDGEGHEVADVLLQRSGSATGRNLPPKSAEGSAKRGVRRARGADRPNEVCSFGQTRSAPG